MSQHSCAKGLQTCPWANTPCEQAKSWNINSWHASASPRYAISKLNARFSRTLGAVATRARLGDDANSPLGEHISDLHRMWAQSAVCRLLAFNVSSLAVIVSLTFSLLTGNVSRKLLLFASPRATVCKPLVRH